MEMNPYLFLDPYLIWFFRLTGQAGWNFLLGTLMVALLALLVGEFTSFLASFLVRRHFTQVAGEAKKYQDLSMEALKAGDRPAYEAANKLANDAFSKYFFMQLALSATFFWPIFFFLGWMQYRFLELEFPIPSASLGYIGYSFCFISVMFCSEDQRSSRISGVAMPFRDNYSRAERGEAWLHTPSANAAEEGRQT
jgi:hypothetical protein